MLQKGKHSGWELHWCRGGPANGGESRRWRQRGSNTVFKAPTGIPRHRSEGHCTGPENDANSSRRDGSGGRNHSGRPWVSASRDRSSNCTRSASHSNSHDTAVRPKPSVQAEPLRSTVQIPASWHLHSCSPNVTLRFPADLKRPLLRQRGPKTVDATVIAVGAGGFNFSSAAYSPGHYPSR
eukprot:superscaffoldBa00002349_g14001